MVKAKVKVLNLKTKAGEAIYEAIERTRGSCVTVGIQEPDLQYPNGATLGQVAAWMEFGTHSKDGAEIVPQRSFIRSTVDGKMVAINRVKDAALRAMMAGKVTLDAALETVGFRIVEMMRDTIVRGMTDGNDKLSPQTLRRKRRLGQPDIPLIATRLLIDHIGFKVLISPNHKEIGANNEGSGHGGRE